MKLHHALGPDPAVFARAGAVMLHKGSDKMFEAVEAGFETNFGNA